MIEVKSDLPCDRNPDVHPACAGLPFRECDAEKHPKAKEACDELATTFDTIYRAHALIEDNLATLKRFDPGGHTDYPGAFDIFDERKAQYLDKTEPKFLSALERAQKADAKLEALETGLRTFVDSHFREPAEKHLATEIRSHVKQLDMGNRVEFLMRAVLAKDFAAVGAVLGSHVPHYLTGFEQPKDKAEMRSVVEQRLFPAEDLQAKCIAKARERLHAQRVELCGRWQQAAGYAQPRGKKGK